MDGVEEVTLSYTFFAAKGKTAQGGEAARQSKQGGDAAEQRKNVGLN